VSDPQAPEDTGFPSPEPVSSGVLHTPGDPEVCATHLELLLRTAATWKHKAVSDHAKAFLASAGTQQHRAAEAELAAVDAQLQLDWADAAVEAYRVQLDLQRLDKLADYPIDA
jgi:hypothetical protein